PSRAPTTTPTPVPTAEPTIQPSVQTSPLVVFNSNLTLAGLTEPVLDAAAQAAVLSASASSMGITVDTVFFTGQIALPNSLGQGPSPRTRRLATTYTVLAQTRVEIPLGTTGFTNATLLYDSLTSALTAAVTTGAYSKTLQRAAVALGAPSLSSANVTSVSNGAIEVDYAPTSDSIIPNLSGGAIAGIAVGVVLFVVLLAAALYFLCRKKTPVERFTPQTGYTGDKGASAPAQYRSRSSAPPQSAIPVDESNVRGIRSASRTGGAFHFDNPLRTGHFENPLQADRLSSNRPSSSANQVDRDRRDKHKSRDMEINL
ncbi:hypothetical protein B484DRAFT_403064, partial [Ochromonadaceae sp. CCMP2298]